MFLVLQYISSLLALIYFLYSLTAFFYSRKPKPAVPPIHANLPLKHNYIFLVPGINEAAVLQNTILNLLALHQNTKIVFVDDASTDQSAQIVDALAKAYPERVFRLRRELPVAQQGKGAALNWAVRRLSRLRIVDENSLLAVFDADGRTTLSLLHEAELAFEDPLVVAAQARIRMRIEGYSNLMQKLMLLNQDLEFHIVRGIQLMRQSFATVGMGGNGQFFRWSYIQQALDRQEDVWPDCLLEDFASGLQARLANTQYRLVFLESEVSQQGVLTPQRFLKQRTRWALGGYQNIGRLGQIWRTALPRAAQLDLTYFILQMPFGALLVLSTLLYLAALFVQLLSGELGLSSLLPSLAFSLIIPSIWSWSYVRENPAYSSQLMLLIFSMPLYLGLMLSSVFLAWAKVIQGDFSWSKTARTREQPLTPAELVPQQSMTQRSP